MNRNFLSRFSIESSGEQGVGPSGKQEFMRSLLRFSVLTGSVACLLVVSGCSGSQLGDTLGQRLEPDPQLAENAAEEPEAEQTTATKPDDSSEAERTNNRSSNSTANNNDSKKPASQPETEKEEKEPEEPQVVGGDYTDLAKAPEEIQPYLVDLLELGLLEVRSPTAKPATPPATPPDGDSENNDTPTTQPATPPPTTPPKADEFRPNQAVTRREYARWLLATNNRFYSGQRTRKVRPAVESSQPVFQDVKASDPDFEAIQGLAEAGIIPSTLTGSSTTLTFRPDAPLTRKDLLLWKVPLDTRQPLPQATPAAVQEAWGFQAEFELAEFGEVTEAFHVE